MSPRHGEVWLVDMGMAAKTRPGRSPCNRFGSREEGENFRFQLNRGTLTRAQATVSLTEFLPHVNTTVIA